MATKATPAIWADGPFALVKIPGQPGAQTCVNPGVMSVCIEMANAHNVILRGLNAIYLQAPFFKDPKDVADFMLYISAWADAVHHHHSGEETSIFPRYEALAKEAGQPCNMHGNVEQHHGFEPQMAKTVDWAKGVAAGTQQYNAQELKKLIDSFAPLLTQHLHDEIDTLIGLEKCDGNKVQSIMKEVADELAKSADPVRTRLFFIIHQPTPAITQR